MNERKYELMEKYLKGETTVNNLIDRIIELEDVEKIVLKAVKPAYSVEDFIIGDRKDAVDILNKLNWCVDKYACVTVADYYEMIGVSPTYVDNTYGWSRDAIKEAIITPVYSASATRVNGFRILFPPVEVI